MDRLKMFTTIAVCALLTSFALAAEETIHFREGGGTGYTDVLIDDTFIVTDPPQDTPYGNTGYNGFSMDSNEVELFAVKDLFTYLPATSGGADINIVSATLHVFRYSGTTGTTVEAFRVTTGWLPDDAGSNENDVTGQHSEKSTDTHWASGNWSSSDYDDTVSCTAPWPANLNDEFELTVTSLIEDIYDAAANYGFACFVYSPDTAQGRASEAATLAQRPSLEITYEYVGGTTYTLTVNSGTGDGSYAESATPTITADAAPSGQDFDKWVGDTAGIASQTSSSTTLTMPAANQEVTATYTDKTWSLTVNSGTGDGSYVVGTVQGITADAAPSGQQFDEWVGDTEGIASVTSSSTTLTMPYANAEVTATYTDVGATTDDVASSETAVQGTVSGDYTDTQTSNNTYESITEVVDGKLSVLEHKWTFSVTGGTTVTFYVEACKSVDDEGDDYTFSYSTNGTTWTDMVTVTKTSDDDNTQSYALPSDLSGTTYVKVVDDNRSNNKKDLDTIYVDHMYIRSTGGAATYTLTVNSGTGDGSYAEDAIADIDADTAPSGQDFDEWVGDTSGIASVTTAETTLTMPAANQEITATYADKTWTLTVNNGTGDGSYVVGTIQGIAADTAPSGQDFDEWVGDTEGIASVTTASTTLTMPYANAEVTATYTDKTWTLTVNNGTGDGSYVVGTVQGITADTAPSGQDFDDWTGDITGIADANDPTTTITMPYADAEITATYTAKTWTLTVNSGTGDGSYVVAAVADIDADAPASGKQFDAWTGDVAGIADVNTADTTLTMPYADAEITATYEDIPTYALTVNSGTGDGSYLPTTVVDITADTAPQGQEFDQWTGDVTDVADIHDSTNTITMPASNAEITATYVDIVYDLTVNSGNGDGAYAQGVVVDIIADTAPSGQDFDEWVGDTANIASVTASSTTITMPASDAEITATYTDKTWTLTVNNGTGDGSYVVGTIQGITADAAPSGQDFDDWTGDVTGIADVNDSTTTITMPYANAEITATYADKTWTLMVNSGTGDGSYAVGAIADIDADTAPSGQQFDEWTGDVSGIASVSTADTTLTMPYANAEITATYEAVSGYSLTVNNGTGDGSYAATTEVGITADAAASGRFFDKWTGDVSGIADINDPSTTLTMPAANQEVTATYAYVVSGLVSRYTFDIDGSDSYGTNDGTLSGASVTTDGTRGEVLSLDGTDDYVDLPEDNMAAGRSEVTLSMWIKADEWVGTNAIYDEDNNNWWQYTITETGWYTRDSSTGSSGSRDNDVSMPSVSTGTWHHLAFVYSVTDDRKEIWYDGSIDNTSTTSIDALTPDRTAARVGRPSDGDYYDGLVDDLRLYSRALTASEIAILAEADLYTLTVNSGAGGGNYFEDDVVDITAGTAPQGQGFDEWVGDTSGIADTGDPTTTITMSAANAEITATYTDTNYTLTVNSGTGDGSYIEDQVANITADAAPSGQDFDAWTGDVSGIASVSSSSTTLTMPAANQEVTATYTDKTWTLVVNSGTGDGSYVVAAVADIDADTPPSGQDFVAWVGDTAGIASVSTADTTLTMPYANQEITATYTDKTWTLVVNSGTGDGSYVVATVVDIDADAAASGYQFDDWTGDVSTVANVNAASTTITMPYANAEITATYEPSSGSYTLTVNNGTGDGSYNSSAVVDITADSAASGKFFDAWTGDTSGIADVNDPTSTLTMPASNQEITATYADVVSGLVSRYTFDMDARDTYGANDGTLSGATVTNDGTRGKVLSLDGTDDYVSLPSSALTAGRSEVTLAMWIKADEWVASNTIWDEYADGNYWQFTIREDEFMTRDTSTGTTGSRANDLVMPSVGTGAWHHLAFVYSVSGGSKALYYDGALSTSTDVSIDALTSSRDGARIGYPCDGEYYDGMIDDVRLYSRALNSAEIAELAEQTEYTLTVNSGSGDGSYVEGYVVNISADAAASGYGFDEWVGDTSGIASVTSSSTTLTMPASNAEITATYEVGSYYTLTVNNGTGDGSYEENDVANIAADAPASGQEFDDWVGDTSGIADVNDAITTLTMPASNQEITATYVSATNYTLTVNSGSGDGSYTQSTVVDIDADSPPSGKTFDDWVGNTSGIANVNAASTTLTMPAANQEITATYVDVGSGPSISSTSGTWSQGNTVTVSGSSFGNTGKEVPIKFDDFESGVVGASLGTGGWSIAYDNGPPAPVFSSTRSWSGSKSGYCDMTEGGDCAAYKSGLSTETFYVSLMYYGFINPGCINQKGVRVHANDGPNIYTSYPAVFCQNPIQSHRYTVAPYDESGSRGDYSPSNVSQNVWTRLEYWFKMSIPGGATNGEVRCWLDLNLQGYNQEITGLTRASGVTDKWTLAMLPFFMGGDAGGEHWYDDAYISYSKARVEIGNASTWSGCSTRQIQGVNSWSNSSVSVKANLGSFGSVSGRYLYVVDNNGNVNANGYAIP